MRYLTAGCCACLAWGWLAVAAAEDAPSRFVTLEVVVADLAEGAAAPPTAAAILEMEKAGKLSGFARFRLTALEDQQASVQFGERVPLQSGRVFRGGGDAQNSYTYVQVGTLVSAVSRVESDGAVVTQLKLERSGVAPQKPGEAADPNAFTPQVTVTLNVQTTVRVKPGEPLVVSGRQLSSVKEAAQTWVVLTASASAAPAGDKKAAANASDEPQLKIVQLRHAAAPALANVLGGVFAKERVNIAVDERTNSLLLRGSTTALEAMLAVISRLDES